MDGAGVRHAVVVHPEPYQDGTEEPKKPSDWELYNIADDPMEENNLTEDHPETRSNLHKMFLTQRSKDKKGS